MQEDKVDRALQKIMELPGEKMQRAWVLKLLEGVRGLSIAELGRVDGYAAASSSSSRKRGSGGGKAVKKGVDYAMMSVEMDGVGDDEGGVRERRPPSPELSGVAELFG